MRTLTQCGKIEVRESSIEGFGVFAKEDISSGTILEEVPFILFPRYVNMAKTMFDLLKNNGWVSAKETYLENLRENFKFKEPERYYFKWHVPVPIDGDSMFTVLPLGCGPIYNTSNTNNNADWKMLRDTFVFRAEKDIPKDQEITTFYGYFLGDDGATFNCDAVFHLAIDLFDSAKGKVHKVKALKFGTVDSLQVQKNNPSALKFHTAIMKSVDGVTLKHIALTQPNGDVIAGGEIPFNIALTPLYRRLSEIRAHPAPLVQFKIEYADKQTNQTVIEDIVWKK